MLADEEACQRPTTTDLEARAETRMTDRSKSETRGAARARRAGLSIVCATIVMALAGPVAAAESEYDAADSGNPVRMSAYVLHPVGVIYDYLILRPAWWVGSHEPFRTFFGRKD